MTEEQASSVSKMVRGYLYNRGMPIDFVEDAAQDVLVSLVGREDRIECLTAYAAAVARNVRASGVARMIEDRARLCQIGGITDTIASGDSPYRDAVEGERLRIADTLLRALPERRREMLVRFYLRGESVQRICAEMGISPNQFRNEVHRAKLRLGVLREGLVSRGRL